MSDGDLAASRRPGLPARDGRDDGVDDAPDARGAWRTAPRGRAAMSRRAVAALVIAPAVALAVAAVVTASFAGGSSQAEGDSRYRGSELPAGIAMPEFSLRNHDGRLIRSGELLSLIHISEPTRLRRISY